MDLFEKSGVTPVALLAKHQSLTSATKQSILQTYMNPNYFTRTNFICATLVVETDGSSAVYSKITRRIRQTKIIVGAESRLRIIVSPRANEAAAGRNLSGDMSQELLTPPSISEAA